MTENASCSNVSAGKNHLKKRLMKKVQSIALTVPGNRTLGSNTARVMGSVRGVLDEEYPSNM